MTALEVPRPVDWAYAAGASPIRPRGFSAAIGGAGAMLLLRGLRRDVPPPAPAA